MTPHMGGRNFRFSVSPVKRELSFGLTTLFVRPVFLWVSTLCCRGCNRRAARMLCKRIRPHRKRSAGFVFEEFVAKRKLKSERDEKMKIAYVVYYRRLLTGSLFIAGIFFLWFLAQTPDLAAAVAAVFMTITLGIPVGASIPGILLCVMTSLFMMGYGLLVRKKFALKLFWSGFALFFLSGMMGMGARY